MTEIEQLILNKLDIMSRDISGVKDELGAVKEEVASIRTEVGELKNRLDKVEIDLEKVKDETARTRLVMENDISRKIDIIGEGHDFLKQRLDEALQMEKKRESMELELVNQRMDLKKIKEHLNIA